MAATRPPVGAAHGRDPRHSPPATAITGYVPVAQTIFDNSLGVTHPALTAADGGLVRSRGRPGCLRYVGAVSGVRARVVPERRDAGRQSK